MYDEVIKGKLWVGHAHEKFAYSDGAEEEVLQILRNSSDVSAISNELESQGTTFALRYHLSQLRANLLRTLDLVEGMRVLELGGGCGAISRSLGETGATVTVVEGSLPRARCIAERTRDLSNVRVYCDNFSDFHDEGGYDLVLLIGVLEYASIYVPNTGEDAHVQALKLAAKFLKPTGCLVIAIENRNGLKYLAGGAEDHCGEAYIGVEDRYSSTGAHTFGRRELGSLLVQSGLECQEFLFPFPDYKFPELVLHERALTCKEFLPASLIAQFDHKTAGTRLNPQLAWPQLAANGLVSELANSFLVVASTSDAEILVPEQFMAACYNGAAVDRQRKGIFKTGTSFLRGDRGRIVVEKHRLDRSLSTACHGTVQQTVNTVAYVPAPLLSQLAIMHILNGNDKGFHECICRWLTYAKTKYGLYGERADEPTTLRGAAIDCVPHNLLLDGDTVIEIDQEWKTEWDMPLQFLYARGMVVLHFLAQGAGCVLPGVLEWLLENGKRAGVEGLSDLASVYEELETRFRDDVFESPARIHLSREQPRRESCLMVAFRVAAKLERKLTRSYKRLRGSLARMRPKP